MKRISKEPDIRRQELMDIGFELYMKNSMGGFSIKDVVNHADVATGLFYYYFKSKGAFVDEILNNFIEKNMEEIQQILVSNELSIMLKQSSENDFINLSACPDHYVLRPFGENGQEVIEYTGNSPLPVQFFIVYGDETGLKTPRDNAYQYQSVGVARMKDGPVIGGVRHQFKNTVNGVEVRASVEFPALCPTSLVKAHQIHLACEFSYWLQWIKDQKNNK